MADYALIQKIISRYDFIPPEVLDDAMAECPKEQDIVDFLVERFLLNERQALVVRKRLEAEEQKSAQAPLQVPAEVLEPEPIVEPEPVEELEPLTPEEMMRIRKETGSSAKPQGAGRRGTKRIRGRKTVRRPAAEIPEPIEAEILEVEPLPSEEDLRGKPFGEILLALKVIEKEGLENALDLQGKLAKSGHSTHVGEILYNAGLLTQSDVILALRMQGRALFRCSTCNLHANVNGLTGTQRPDCPECFGRLLEIGKDDEISSTSFKLVDLDFLSSDPLVGAAFKDFRILQPYCRSVSTAIYRGEQTSLARPVGIQILNEALCSSEQKRDAFVNCARNAARQTFHSITTGIDVGLISGRPCYVFEFPEGHSVEEYVLRKGMLPVKTAARLAFQVMDALSFSHAKGDFAGVVEPVTVFITAGFNAKMFSSASNIAGMTTGGTALPAGSPAYMAPEVLAGDPPTALSDSYAVGCLLYFMLSGQPPMHGANWVDLAARQIFIEPQPISTIREDIPREAEKILNRLLAKEIERRFARDEEVLAALASIAGEKYNIPISIDDDAEVPTPIGGQSRKRVSRRPRRY
ncbi:MAG: serine/threonine-protein kinase [Candidatus Brocadiia bacterium]